MITLMLPPGADEGEISHGTEQYRPYRDKDGPWLVDVPEEVAAGFLMRGGFKVMARASAAQPQDDVSAVKMVHPDGPKAVGWRGNAFEPDADGAVSVPAAAVDDLRSHGFLFPGEADTRDLDARDRRIAELEAEVQDIGDTRNEQIADLEADNAKRDQRIADLEAENAKLREIVEAHASVLAPRAEAPAGEADKA